MLLELVKPLLKITVEMAHQEIADNATQAVTVRHEAPSTDSVKDDLSALRDCLQHTNAFHPQVITMLNMMVERVSAISAHGKTLAQKVKDCYAALKLSQSELSQVLDELLREQEAIKALFFSTDSNEPGLVAAMQAYQSHRYLPDAYKAQLAEFLLGFTVDKVEGVFNQLVAPINRFKDKLSVVAEHSASTQSKVVALESHAQAAVEALDAVRQTPQTLQQKIAAAFEVVISTKDQQIKHMQVELTALKQSLQQRQAVISRQQTSISELQASIEALESRIAAEVKAREQIQGLLAESQATVETKTAEVAALGNEISAARAKYCEFASTTSAKINALETAATKSQAEIARLLRANFCIDFDKSPQIYHAIKKACMKVYAVEGKGLSSKGGVVPPTPEDKDAVMVRDDVKKDLSKRYMEEAMRFDKENDAVNALNKLLAAYKRANKDKRAVDFFSGTIAKSTVVDQIKTTFNKFFKFENGKLPSEINVHVLEWLSIILHLPSRIDPIFELSLTPAAIFALYDALLLKLESLMKSEDHASLTHEYQNALYVATRYYFWVLDALSPLYVGVNSQQAFTVDEMIANFKNSKLVSDFVSRQLVFVEFVADKLPSEGKRIPEKIERHPSGQRLGGGLFGRGDKVDKSPRGLPSSVVQQSMRQPTPSPAVAHLESSDAVEVATQQMSDTYAVDDAAQSSVPAIAVREDEIAEPATPVRVVSVRSDADVSRAESAATTASTETADFATQDVVASPKTPVPSHRAVDDADTTAGTLAQRIAPPPPPPPPPPAFFASSQSRSTVPAPVTAALGQSEQPRVSKELLDARSAALKKAEERGTLMGVTVTPDDSANKLEAGLRNALSDDFITKLLAARRKSIGDEQTVESDDDEFSDDEVGDKPWIVARGAI